ncbi:MAG: single-stranded DNA-binding protein, partial [Proteobacteria bacterium]|nr:single-stranded DNA-binding protein [Pseudomonadota bacterium]
IVFGGPVVETVTQYLHKGSTVYVEGRLRTRKWQDKDKQDRYTTEVVARSFQFLDKKQGDGVPAGYESEEDVPM